MKKYKAAYSVVVLFSQTCVAVFAAGPVDETALKGAWALYTQQKFAASADAFETLIKSATPNPRLYYYAAVANKSSNRLARAKQLGQYVITNFSSSPEAVQFQKLFPELASQSAGVSDDLPQHLKGKKLEELMQTEEGRKALQDALKKQSTTSAASAAPASTKPKDIERVVNADAVAIDGAEGITHFDVYSDDWVECSMASLALLPRGHRILADMIRNPGGHGTFVVRFPGDSQEFQLTPQKIEEMQMRDKAQWATLIHCALYLKLGSGNSSLTEEALTILTGKKAEAIHVNATTEQALSSFIDKAVKSHSPIVCSSAEDSAAPTLVEPGKAFSITGFDTATGMITIRSPHGSASRRFRLITDPEHKKFEQLNCGVCRMHITLFPKYFEKVARSTI